METAEPFEFALTDLLSDDSLRRRHFPVTGERVFLAHAAVSPLPACTVNAIVRYAEEASRTGQFSSLLADTAESARRMAAELVGGHPDEIAFVSSTSAGLSVVAQGLPWQSGDNVIVSEGDFPANIYPWLNLTRRGIEMRSIPCRSTCAVSWEDIEPLIDHRSRLVSLSTVHYVTGATLDIETIGRNLHQRGVFLCLDAIQGLGALPISAKWADFLVADSHKWLLGPAGAGIIWVNRQHMDTLHPVLLGWNSVAQPRNYTQIRLEPASTARRYEPGCLNAVGVMGLNASLRMILHIGITSIVGQLTSLRKALVIGLEAQGFQVLGEPACHETCITSFSRPDINAAQLCEKLGRRGFILSLRRHPNGTECIRVSPHFYNTATEVESFLSCLADLVRS